MSAADWIHEGATVAEYYNSYYDPRVSTAKIARITKTQIVLDNGNRYNMRCAQIGEKRSLAGYSTELRPITDPQVVDTLARAQFADVARLVEVLAGRNKNERTSATDVLAALDQIEQAVHAARQAITGKEE
ncbi:hypothetical protein [Micromonospora sp. NBC_00421]|uniref:hypothetical protein n=1 Tax=Micromonospora sp. NBC_00421 TaxID=2975976 RepID=UPI002E1AC737